MFQKECEKRWNQANLSARRNGRGAADIRGRGDAAHGAPGRRRAELSVRYSGMRYMHDMRMISAIYARYARNTTRHAALQLTIQ